MSNKEITISLEEYKNLQEASQFLEALNTVGVDSWDGYEEAHEIFIQSMIEQSQ